MPVRVVTSLLMVSSLALLSVHPIEPEDEEEILSTSCDCIADTEEEESAPPEKTMHPMAAPQMATPQMATPQMAEPQMATPMRDHRLSVGGNYTYVHFTPEGTPSFHGNLGGMQLLYEYHPTEGLYASLHAHWSQGETESTSASRFLVVVEAEEQFGYTTATMQGRWTWSFFSGLGYRYTGHHLEGTGEPMRFNYNTFYVPLGLYTDYLCNNWFSWGLHTTWMPQFYPTVTTLPLGGNRWETQCTFANTRVELPLTFTLNRAQSCLLTLQPLFTYWQDGATTAKTLSGQGLDLPSNSYFFWGVDLNLSYAF